MKKIIYFLFILLFAFVAGCSEDEKTTDPIVDPVVNPTFTISTISVDPQFAFAFYCSMDVYLFSYEVINPLQQSYGVTALGDFQLLVGQAYTDAFVYPKLSGLWRVHFKGKKLSDQKSFDVWAQVNISAKNQF
ncbi:MAG: hypothetical protein V1720_12835 [bacterium]